MKNEFLEITSGQKVGEVGFFESWSYVMKSSTCLALIVAIFLVGCTSTKQSSVESAPVTAFNAQKLESKFIRSGIKIEYECAYGTGMFGMSDAICLKTDLKAIEVTGYGNSFGNSEALREGAFTAAEMNAKAKFIRWINEDVVTNIVKQTVQKNVEKGQDRIKQRIKSDEAVEMSDQDASKETNFAVRENNNEIVNSLIESIRNNAQGKLRGTYVKQAEIVDRQTVKVVIRWDNASQKAAETLRLKFGN